MDLERSGPTHYPERSGLRRGLLPYCKNYRGAEWNAQGLFHSKASKQEKKWKHVLKILRGRDFLLINETHTNQGKTKAFDEKMHQLGFRAFWSHGGNRRAGVGILVRHEFLALFASMPPQWIDISPGEIGCLRLTGTNANLEKVIFF